MLKVIGTMSGTSGDGVDLAYIETDGEEIKDLGAYVNFPYPVTIKTRLQNNDLNYGQILELEYDISCFYAEKIAEFIKSNNYQNIDLIGFHGQTVFHLPEKCSTWQLGNPHILTAQLQIPVVTDFRRKDLSMGGQGAPLVPIYHKILARKLGLVLPCAIINIGGVANITYIEDDMIQACDLGPGGALIDDVCRRCFNKEYDLNGEIARQGKINQSLVEEWLKDPYFAIKGTKSLDRNYFAHLTKLEASADELVANLTYFTATAITKGLKINNFVSEKIILCGGGAYNKYLRELIQELNSKSKVEDMNDYKVNSQAIEAQAFGLIAARTVNKLPSSFNSTTGINRPVVCGVFYPV